MNVETIKTPSLLLDLDRVRRNAARISDIASKNRTRLRAHIKTHKCIEVAKIQTAGHNGAITVSTLAEARDFAANGFTDITYAVPIEPGKFADATEILRGGVKLNLLTDNAESAKLLDEAAGRAIVKFEVFVKIDCGTHRVGVEPHTAEAVDIPRQLSDAKNLHFAGILTHAGHSYDVKTVDEIKAIARHERDVMVEHAAKLRWLGIEVPTVSIGSTPTINHIDHLDGIDEVRPGNYIFFDNYQATLGSCSFDDTALTVLAAIVHRDASRRKIVIDAGGIAMSKDRGPVHLDPQCGYGRVLDLDGNPAGLSLDSLSQEHGVMHAADDAIFNRFKIGDRVRILANHSCMTAAQHTHYNVLENGEIVDQWKIHAGW
ncbi:MAG TPA: alanine racemase [Pyrinomonadaceae bacterium]|nr:alanine racemase [Acidobacteriota bacterium]HQZ95216.1 alanine racemase [Pyrinomonadaceae bacterium]